MACLLIASGTVLLDLRHEVGTTRCGASSIGGHALGRRAPRPAAGREMAGGRKDDAGTTPRA